MMFTWMASDMLSLRPHIKPQWGHKIIFLATEGIMYGELPIHIPRMNLIFLLSYCLSKKNIVQLYYVKGLDRFTYV